MVMSAVFVMDMLPGRTASGSDLNESHLEFGKNSGKEGLLVLREISPGLLSDHLELVDEHFGGLEIGFGLPCLGMLQQSEAEQDVLHLHPDKENESLGEVGGVRGLLDFGHIGRFFGLEDVRLSAIGSLRGAI